MAFDMQTPQDSLDLECDFDLELGETANVPSTLTAILGRMAMDRRREVTWDEMMKSA